MTKTGRILAFFAAFAATIVFAFGAAATASAKGGGSVVDPGDGGGSSALQRGSCTWANIGAWYWSAAGEVRCEGDGYWHLHGTYSGIVGD